jgi:hypothetical protein
MGAEPDTDPTRPLIFATYAETPEEWRQTHLLAESIRTFAGRFSRAPVWIYVPEPISDVTDDMREPLQTLDVKVEISQPPAEAEWFYYAGKTFAAGRAEAAAAGKAAALVWMDSDTLLLQEPTDFALSDGIACAYRPVMHNRSGSLAAEPPDPFWSRIYETLGLDPESLFSMVTPADRQTIRAYFNAGLLVVRPELGILRKWGESFTRLIRDSALVDMCHQDVDKRIFLHQTALVGAVLNTVERGALLELSDAYNYPIFFQKMFGADSEFDSIEQAVTLRYDIYFRDPAPDWSRQLTGPAHKLSWLKERLGGE